MTRFRDLLPMPDHLPTGRMNAITDVPGVRVGHVTRIKGSGKLTSGRGPIRTGITAILPHPGNIFREKLPAAVYTINGYGKATGFEQIRDLGVIETPICLTGTLNVGRVWDAVVTYSIRENPDIAITTSNVSPIVGRMQRQHAQRWSGSSCQRGRCLAGDRRRGWRPSGRGLRRRGYRYIVLWLQGRHWHGLAPDRRRQICGGDIVADQLRAPT